MAYELREQQGTLHPNDRRTDENRQPDFTGRLLLNGVTYRLAAWRYVTGSGKSWLSLRAQPADERKPEAEKSQEPTSPPRQAEFNDDIPF
jgi:hypothetical protein